MPIPIENPMEKLAVANPETAAAVASQLGQLGISSLPADAAPMVDEIIQALSQEESFGRALADGYVRLISTVSPVTIDRYCREVKRAGKQGPSLGRIIATHYPSVLMTANPTLENRFFKAINTLIGKGMHLLNSPLQCLNHLLSAGETRAGANFLELIHVAFSANLTYNRARALAHLLSTRITELSPPKRSQQTQETCRVAGVSTDLIDPFLEGIEKGLYLLSQKALSTFVAIGLEKYARNNALGKAFLGLDSQLARQVFKDMQVSVPLSQIQNQMNRYLRARTGNDLGVKPLSALSAASFSPDPPPMVCSDARFIYLPMEISLFGTQKKNRALYKNLMKMEAGYHEFGTFDFDIDKLQDNWPDRLPPAQSPSDLSDLEQFFMSFPNAGLACDLFTIAEWGRIHRRTTDKYPGIIRQITPLLTHEIKRLIKENNAPQTGLALLTDVVFGPGHADRLNVAMENPDDILPLIFKFESLLIQNPAVETSAGLTMALYPILSKIQSRVPLPFGRRIRADLVRAGRQRAERLAGQIKYLLEAQGHKVYRSDLRNHLSQNHDCITPEELTVLIQKASPLQTPPPPQPGLKDALTQILSKLYGSNESVAPLETPAEAVFWYPEWDNQLNDYKNKHARVMERDITRVKGNIYQEIVNRNQALVDKIRYAFELLKPEELSVLRHWTEGDEFDYRALIDAAIDRKIGRIPSDRLYIKRIKHQRDVAVMLLVDLSRSTANAVPHTGKTILDVEREAIVLFCEALLVIGDSFAISGFSGNGRLGVDYWRIKAFADPMGNNIHERICAMAPQRSTRLGSAIRHSVAQLEKMPKKIRILITLGDGFPNDTGYKGDYAVNDTRKAISEARAKGIYLRPITINPTQDRQINAMYGNLHHNVITDVRQLPDKLWRIYSTLTR